MKSLLHAMPLRLRRWLRLRHILPRRPETTPPPPAARYERRSRLDRLSRLTLTSSDEEGRT